MASTMTRRVVQLTRPLMPFLSWLLLVVIWLPAMLLTFAIGPVMLVAFLFLLMLSEGIDSYSENRERIDRCARRAITLEEYNRCGDP